MVSPWLTAECAYAEESTLFQVSLTGHVSCTLVDQQLKNNNTHIITPLPTILFMVQHFSQISINLNSHNFNIL